MLQESFGDMSTGTTALDGEDILFIGAGDDNVDLFVEVILDAFEQQPIVNIIVFIEGLYSVASPPQRLRVTTLAMVITILLIFIREYLVRKVGTSIQENPVNGECSFFIRTSSRGGIVTCILHHTGMVSLPVFYILQMMMMIIKATMTLTKLVL